METEPSHIFDWYQFTPFLLADSSVGILLNALSISFLLVCSGLLSGSEVAFFSLKHKERKQLTEEVKNASSARILELLSTPRYLLSTILIANNVVNIAIILVSNSLLKQLMIVPLLEQYVPLYVAKSIDMFVTIGVVTFLLVLFGEVAPKVYSTKNNMKIARFMSRPLFVMRTLCRPISIILVKSTRLVENRLRAKMNQNTVTQEDIAQAIELTITDDNAEQDVGILKGIVRFGTTSAAEIMKPRMKVVALEIDSSFEELLDIFREEPYSRIPIYQEDLDSIKGIIHAKDLLEYIDQEERLNWHQLIRPPLVVPEMKKIDDLFHDFQEKRTHMAIVVDEYGGTKGIVTMEDILEEIVGEIQDEFDNPEEEIYDKIDEYTYDFDGSTAISDMCKVLDIKADYFDDIREGAETIAGLVLVINGFIPSLNTPIECKSYLLITLAATKRRIEKIRIVLPHVDNINFSSSVSEEN